MLALQTLHPNFLFHKSDWLCSLSSSCVKVDHLHGTSKQLFISLCWFLVVMSISSQCKWVFGDFLFNHDSLYLVHSFFLTMMFIQCAFLLLKHDVHSTLPPMDTSPPCTRETTIYPCHNCFSLLQQLTFY